MQGSHIAQLLDEERSLDWGKMPDELSQDIDQMQQDCKTLTFRGTEKFAVRMMASAIA